MDQITYPNIIDAELLEKEELDWFRALPLLIQKTVLMTCLYQNDGMGSAYTVWGLANEKYLNGVFSVSPGIALFQDMVICSMDGKGREETYALSPSDGDIVTVSYITLGYEGEPKYRVNDVTKADAPVDTFKEEQDPTGPSKTLYTLELKYYKPTAFIDLKTNIPLYVYNAEKATFVPYRVSVSVTTLQHREEPVASHPDGSVTAVKLSADILGKASEADSMAYTLKDSSDLGREICGIFRVPDTSRVDFTIGGVSKFPPGWREETPGAYGIDDIFLEICREILLKNSNRPSISGNGTEWVDYTYHAKNIPCIAFETNKDGKPFFKLNPDAVMHKAGATRMAAKTGVINQDGEYISRSFDGGTGCVPLRTIWGDIALNALIAICSLRHVDFIHSAYDNMICLVSDARVMNDEIGQDRVFFYSKVIRYTRMVDSRMYKDFDAAKFFENYTNSGAYTATPPSYMKPGYNNATGYLLEYKASSNYLMVGRKLGRSRS